MDVFRSSHRCNVIFLDVTPVTRDCVLCAFFDDHSFVALSLGLGEHWESTQ